MAEDDPMVSCPFDSGHRHLRSRMPYHIMKCSKNDPRKHLFVNKKQCAFDATHWVEKEDYEKHVAEDCAAARRVLNCNNLDEEDQTESSILPVNPEAKPRADKCDDGGWSDGDWGDEANHPSYNPQEANANRAVAQAQIGSSKAQRKKHRMQERRRINQLTQDQAGSSSKQ